MHLADSSNRTLIRSNVNTRAGESTSKHALATRILEVAIERSIDLHTQDLLAFPDTYLLPNMISFPAFGTIYHAGREPKLQGGQFNRRNVAH